MSLSFSEIDTISLRMVVSLLVGMRMGVSTFSAQKLAECRFLYQVCYSAVQPDFERLFLKFLRSRETRTNCCFLSCWETPRCRWRLQSYCVI